MSFTGLNYDAILIPSRPEGTSSIVVKGCALLPSSKLLIFPERTLANAPEIYQPFYQWEADACGMVTYISPNFELATGLLIAACVGWGWVVAIHPEDRVRHVRQWCRAIAEGKGSKIFSRTLTASGSYCPTLTTALPILDSNGIIEGWNGRCRIKIQTSANRLLVG